MMSSPTRSFIEKHHVLMARKVVQSQWSTVVSPSESLTPMLHLSP